MFLGSPPYYQCDHWVDGTTRYIGYLSSSNVMPVVTRDAWGFDDHTVIAYVDQVIKLASLREVLQAAAIQFPSRFATTNSGTDSLSTDVRDILGIINGALRIISMSKVMK